MNEYRPGTVAVATVRGVPNVRVLRVALGTTRKNAAGWVHASDFPDERQLHGASLSLDDQVTDVRPLVTLDPEDREQCRDLADRIAPNMVGNTNATQAALREMARPKPAEPTGLGAVVRCEYDGRKGTATYTGAGWTFYGGRLVDHSADWYAFDAVRVLSEGVQP